MIKIFKIVLLLIGTWLLLACTRAQQKDQELATASMDLGLASLRGVQNGTSAVVVASCIFDGLAMLLEGAKNTTESQLLKKVFKTDKADDVQKHQVLQRQTIGNYSKTKMNYVDIVTLKREKGLQIRIKGVVNGKIVENVNVENDSKESMEKLNKFISRLTNGIVKDAFEAEPQKNPLLLTNAVHFKALWQNMFDTKFTKIKPFYVESDKCKVNGQNPTVPLMYSFAPVPYNKFPYLFNATGVRLPFADNETSFYALLPPDLSVTVDKLLSALNGKVWMKIVEDLAHVEVSYNYDYNELKEKETILQMPAFNTSSSIWLKKTLQNLGVTDMFDTTANFSNFNAGSRLYVADVKHKAYLKINEQGAEGAGLTQTVLVDRTFQRTFRANRPFLYVIANTRDGDVYFTGRFMGPIC